MYETHVHFYNRSADFFPACSNTRWVRTPVTKNADVIITLEERQKEGDIVGQAYQHPCSIDKLQLKKLMGSLIYMDEVGLMGKEKKMPVFQAIEIERLAPVLAGTLAQATDSQRIRFTSFNRGKGLIFSVSRKTEGVVFMALDSRLNFAFNYINAEIRMDETKAFPEDFSHTDPLEISYADTALVESAPYFEKQTLPSGKPSPLWVAVDMEKLAAAAPPEMTPGDNLSKTPAQASEEAAAGISPVPAPEPTITLQEEIKTKLIYLKELLDEGLITETDYNAKKDALLEKLD